LLDTPRTNAAARNVSIFIGFRDSGLTIVKFNRYNLHMADVGVAWSNDGHDGIETLTVGRTERISRVTDMEAGMALPKIVVRGKKVILLSGFKDEDQSTSAKRHGVVVDAKAKLVLAAKRNPDAVAFGFIAGEWVASA
jgi:hypothetical protein